MTVLHAAFRRKIGVRYEDIPATQGVWLRTGEALFYIRVPLDQLDCIYNTCLLSGKGGHQLHKVGVGSHCRGRRGFRTSGISIAWLRSYAKRESTWEERPVAGKQAFREVLYAHT